MGSDREGAPEQSRGHPRLAGRRHGRKLRRGLDALMARRFPELAIALPPAGETLDPAPLFPAQPSRIWLEIGFGSGEHLAWQAAHNPDVALIGAEIYVNGIAALVRALDDAGLGNVRILRGDGRDLVEALPDGSLERVFALFPDPWPKARHHKRRLLGSETLNQLARVLADDGELRIATDHPGYLSWIVERVSGHPAFDWLERGPADWRCRPSDWPQTRYESKALGEGRQPVFLRCRRVPRAAACPA